MLLHIILFLFTFPLAMALGTLQGSTSRAVNNTAKPNCPTHCGNVSVPYPFGIGMGCALDDPFYVTCNKTDGNNPKLFLNTGNIEIFNFSVSEFRIRSYPTFKCYTKDGIITNDYEWWTQLVSPFTFSKKNIFTVVGCDDFSLITGENFTSACYGYCTKVEDLPDGRCPGPGCCQTSIPKGLEYYNVTLETFQNHTDVWSFNPCGYAFLAEEGNFAFRGLADLSSDSADDLSFVDRVWSTVPTLVDWVIAPGRNCSESTVCKENSSCYDVDDGGYHCKCNIGYEGNPYLGCQDINECDDSRVIKSCYGDCVNTPGGSNCTCPLGYFGNAYIENGCQPNRSRSKVSLIILITATTFCLLALLFIILGIIYGVRRKKLMKLREKFFEKNGGVLLKQKIKSQGSREAMTLFSIEQLRKATNSYSQENIIGRGGYGVVYKGVLSDKRVVAIKKSKIVDGDQAEQFINEVLILTQVIHRNVVNLLGCCLEEEVPVLVYEFISNNTLFHHIHSRAGGMSWLSWENRLRIAVEAASALAYLHSETIMPIIHRDVKSPNILLDDNYTAKISDFGASRLVPLDHEQVTTLIQGTLGYLDPEYYNTSQLTEKSDVYSFGVVLAELITGKKPIGVDRSNCEKNLATYFVNSVKENRLYEIVEPRILREGTLEQIQAVGELVKRCLILQGQDRPTMKEIVVELDTLRKFTTRPWTQQQTFQDTGISVLEVEQSDLYEVPLVSYDTNDTDSYMSSTYMAFEKDTPR